MATHDYIISNASGASVRADLNNALAAIVSNNSNATSPATTYAYQWWADTTTGQLKLRNSANSAWITIFELDGTMLMEDGTLAAPGLAFASDLDTGFSRSAANKINFSTGGAERLEIGSSEVVFNDPSNDVDFRVESNGNANMLFVDAGNDRVGLGIGTPTSVLDVRDTQTGAASEIKLFNLDQGNTTTQTSALVMTPDVRANGAKIAVVKEVADFSSTANKDVAITFSPVLNNTAVEAARIDSSGRVGVGTTSPSMQDGNANPVVHLYHATSPVEFRAQRGNGCDAFFTARSTELEIGTNTSHAMLFRTNDAERAKIDANGNLEVSGGQFTVGTTATTGLQLINDGTFGTLQSADLVFRTNSSERARIDTSGRFLHQHSSAITANSETRKFQIINNTNNGNHGLGIYSFTSSNFAPRVDLGSSPNSTVGSFTTASSSGSQLGQINFLGSDGDEFLPAARIETRVDGTAANGDMPGRLIFMTSADGTSSPTERLRIGSDGMVELRANQGTAETNIIRFTDTDTSVAASQKFGQLQWFSNDASGGGPSVKGEIYVVARDTTPDGDMVFATHDGSGTNTAENIRLISEGGLTFNGDTAVANALNDYEEGTFTPALSFSNLSVSSYDVQNGSYVKVGRQVHVAIYIRFSGSNLSGTPQTGGAIYLNLPFTAGTGYSGTQYIPGPAALGRLAEFRGSNGSTDFDTIYHHVSNNSSSMAFGVNKMPQSPQSTDFLYSMSEKSFNGLIGVSNNFEYRHSFTYESYS